MKFSSETPSIKSEASKCTVKNKQHSHCVIIHLNLKLSCIEVITNNETKTFLSKQMAVSSTPSHVEVMEGANCIHTGMNLFAFMAEKSSNLK